MRHFLHASAAASTPLGRALAKDWDTCSWLVRWVGVDDRVRVSWISLPRERRER